ncbi:MAG: leucyl aminopeptidase family protein, partial [Bdellovibrionales bacterium]
MKITFAKTLPEKIKTVILPVYEGPELSDSAKSFAKTHKAKIAQTVKNNPGFTGKHGQSLVINGAGDIHHIVLIGLGKAKDCNALKAESAGGKAHPTLKALGCDHAALPVTDDKALTSITTADFAAHFAAGLRLRSYTFERYKSKDKDDKTPAFKSLSVICDTYTQCKKTYTQIEPVIDGVFTARDLVNEPPNHLYPDAYAKFIANTLKPLGVKITIIDEKKMAKAGMEAILAVGKGSERQPRMVVMEWNGQTQTAKSKSKDAPLALVGKGVTFDTGGISIKPGAGMDEMKMDMGGSAAVVGTIKALALRKAKTRVIGVVGLAENMPSHNAYRPGDIIGSLSGKTIEVLNTDAEGRLVLADCLTHVQRTY